MKRVVTAGFCAAAFLLIAAPIYVFAPRRMNPGETIALNFAVNGDGALAVAPH